ncbi:MAG: YhcB family protein [Pseudomonadales bacterium]|nr:YhcB family protein [Pseudomonadales bacterium]
MSLVSVLMFIVGVALGAGGCLFVVRQTRSESSIEKQLRELQEEFTAYRENVNQHFNQTAKLVNELTNNYIAVQKHLGEAAESFAQPPKSFDLQEDDTEKLENKREDFLTLETKAPMKTEEDAQFENGGGIEQPKDYAPKSAKEKGTLAEDFGLQETIK